MKSKLIRDNIPSILEKKGIIFRTHIADESEYASRLDEKLLEEVHEYLSSKNVEELADILEVIHSLASKQNISMSEIETMRLKKKDARGGFSKRIILDESP